jgi:hypothetical protein
MAFPLGFVPASLWFLFVPAESDGRPAVFLDAMCTPCPYFLPCWGRPRGRSRQHDLWASIVEPWQLWSRYGRDWGMFALISFPALYQAYCALQEHHCVRVATRDRLSLWTVLRAQ